MGNEKENWEKKLKIGNRKLETESDEGKMETKEYEITDNKKNNRKRMIKKKVLFLLFYLTINSLWFFNLKYSLNHIGTFKHFIYHKMIYIIKDAVTQRWLIH